jgi:hypothetical protein
MAEFSKVMLLDVAALHPALVLTDRTAIHKKEVLLLTVGALAVAVVVMAVLTKILERMIMVRKAKWVVLTMVMTFHPLKTPFIKTVMVTPRLLPNLVCPQDLQIISVRVLGTMKVRLNIKAEQYLVKVVGKLHLSEMKAKAHGIWRKFSPCFPGISQMRPPFASLSWSTMSLGRHYVPDENTLI